MSKISEDRRNILADVLSEVLTQLCARNDRFLMKLHTVTRFQASQAPQITIKSYLKRIMKYSNCSEQCFVLALIYIDRLIRVNEKFMLNSLNVHRLMITSVMLGAKFFDDRYYNNKHFGKVGGVSCKEINLLEIEFVFMINFNLYVETDLYETYSKWLENQVEVVMKESFHEPCRVVKAHETKAKATQLSKNATVNSSESTIRSSISENRSANSLRSICSKPRVSQAAAKRVRPRCVPLSPNFLKTLRRIQTKTN